MYTWFDTLLVTLLAIVTALGAQRGLIGLVWGVAAALICLLVNAMFPNAALAALAALVLSVGVAFVCVRLMPDPHAQPWSRLAGGVGGFVLGSIVLGALALSFPLDIKQTAKGTTASYPSAKLPDPFDRAVHESVVKSQLMGVWDGHRALRLLLIPDRTH